MNIKKYSQAPFLYENKESNTMVIFVHGILEGPKPVSYTHLEDAYSGIEAINTSGMYSVGVGDKKTLKNANLVVEDTTYLEFDTLMDIFNK